jgi:hypothetical protein
VHLNRVPDLDRRHRDLLERHERWDGRDAVSSMAVDTASFEDRSHVFVVGRSPVASADERGERDG